MRESPGLDIPVPPVEMFTSMVDVLAKRYGWSYSDIAEDMYWEKVYEMYEYASNLDALETNGDRKFDFMIHAQSKEAIQSWQDMPIPFPDPRVVPIQAPIEKSQDGMHKLSEETKTVRTKLRTQHSATVMTPEQRKRRDHVAKRLREHKENMAKIQRDKYYGG